MSERPPYAFNCGGVVPAHPPANKRNEERLMISSMEALLMARADETLARVGLPTIGADKADDIRRHRLLKAILRAANGPADSLVDALLLGSGAKGKSARADMRTKAEGAAWELAEHAARFKAAVADVDNGGFLYVELDGHRVPITDVTRRRLGLPTSDTFTKAEREYIAPSDKTEIVVTDRRTKSGKRVAHLARVKRVDLTVPDIAGDDITPRHRPAVDAFMQAERLAKADEQAKRDAFDRAQQDAALRGRAAAMRHAADPTQEARIGPYGNLIPAPDDVKAQAEADARHARLTAERDAEAAEDARRLKALDDARHADAVREHQDRAKRIGF